MDEVIKHDGVVLSVGDTTVRVQIVQTSACAACKAKQMCMSAESRVKEMDVIPLEPLQAGDEVEVSVRERLGWRAVLLAYILPFVVLIGVVFVLGQWFEEVIAGTIALLAVGIYYVVLRGFKGRIEKTFRFTARKKEQQR